MAEKPARRAPGWTTLQATFALLAGALLLAFLLPLLAFLPDVDGAELARQVERAGLARSLAVSGASATLATLLAALGGVPLGYLLARDRVRFPWLVRTLVLIPLVLPPVAAGVLLLNVYGPGGLVGGILESAGWTLVNSIGGIVIAQVFITAPFVVLTAEAAFRAVDPRLEAVGATLGRTHGEIFRRISLPLARYGLLAGLALAWMRAAGEFGATVVLAYHPRSLPVHLWVELTGRGLRAALPVALVALALAAAILLLAQRFEARTRNGRNVTRLRGPARDAPGRAGTATDVIPEPSLAEGPLIEARFSLRLGGFLLAADLDAHQEILSLFGPSGAGKSTFLRVVAGLLDPDAGRLSLAGATVFREGKSVPPEERPVGLVFQEPSLFPHLSVGGNVLFAGDGPDATSRFERLVEVTRLEGLEDRYPSELSGGQQQRVALARALMQQPRILLLDEPFSSLDTNMRERLHDDVKRIEQVGDPLAVIRHPATFDVARFVGVRNLFEGTVREVAAGRAVVETGDLVLEAAWRAGVEVSGPVWICIRPEDFIVSRAPSEEEELAGNSIVATLRSRQLRGPTFTLGAEAIGSSQELRMEIELPVRTYEKLDLTVGEEVVVTVPLEAVHLIPFESPKAGPAAGPGCDDDPTRVVLTAERRVR
jgi:molybdate transport system permease protein